MNNLIGQFQVYDFTYEPTLSTFKTWDSYEAIQLAKWRFFFSFFNLQSSNLSTGRLHESVAKLNVTQRQLLWIRDGLLHYVLPLYHASS